MNVLVLCAHPDDETLGCGGWIAKLTDEGHSVQVVFTTDGVRHAPVGTDSRADSLTALNILGVPNENVFYLDIPTQRSDGHVLRDYTSRLLAIAKDIDLVITTSPDDLNLDHVFAARLGQTCFRPIKRQTRIVCMETLSSTEYSENAFNPNFYVDISKQVDRKIAALNVYQHQIMPFPHPRSEEAIRIHAQHRGLEVGYHAAECFRIIRWFED